MIATFDTAPEAHAARVFLEGEGVRAAVTDDVAVTTLWHVGAALGGVKLLVSEKDAENAAQLLAHGENETSRDVPDFGWKCAGCKSEVDAGFAVCWKCGAPFNGAATAQDVQSDSPAAKNSTTSYHADVVFADSGESDSGISRERDDALERRISRAWRASVIGLFLCPGLLHLYSIALLLQSINDNSRMTKVDRRRFIGAWIVDVVAGIVVGAGLLTFLSMIMSS